jgi:hypothetical protein
VLDLYLSLCAEAGPVCQQVLERETGPAAEHTAARGPTPEADHYRLQLMRMGYRLAREEQKLRSLENDLARLRENQSTVASINSRLREHDEVLCSLGPLVRALNALRAVRTRLRSVWRSRNP